MDKLFLTSGQIKTFCLATVAGLIIGILYTGIQLLRFILGGQKLATCFCDGLFGFSFITTTIVASLILTNGRLRLYFFLAIALGFFIYLLALHAPLEKFSIKLLTLHRERVRKKKANTCNCGKSNNESSYSITQKKDTPKPKIAKLSRRGMSIKNVKK